MPTKRKETQKGKSQPAAKTPPSTKGKAAPKAVVKAAPKAPKAKPVDTGPRHPRGRLVAAHGSKEAFAKTVAAAIARPDEDADVIAARLRTASNRQLLRLAAANETVKKRWGSREKLIAAIGAAQKKGKDQEFLTKLDTYSLPRLVDLASAATRRARA